MTGNAGAPLVTANSGQAYIEECLGAGVPVPTTVTDPSEGWVNRGNLSTTFIGDLADDNEIWSWESPDPVRPGVCLALPRWTPDNEAKLFGIICLGTRTSRACFFDNDSNEPRWPRYEVRSIDDFIGGADLITNGQGVCTDCHAGENPFVVHPEDPAFEDLVRSGVLQPPGWYEPIVGEGWPQNPGPIALPPVPAGETECSVCHDRGSIAGRFPDISQLWQFSQPQPPEYCSAVLENAISVPTMPPSDFGGADFTTHTQYLLSLCNTGGGSTPGTLETGPGPAADPDYLSPPEVIPMYECTNVIGVRNAKMGATVELSGTGTGGPWTLTATVRDPALTLFTIPVPTDASQSWTARQNDGSAWSVSSGPVSPRDASLDFPTGLPAPDIVPDHSHECAASVAVGHVPGANLIVERNGSDFDHPGNPTGYSNVAFKSVTFATSDQITVRQQLCRDPSLPSNQLDIRSEPSSLPELITDPLNLYEGQELILIGDIVPGAYVELTSSIDGPFASLPSFPATLQTVDVATPLSRPLTTGEELQMQQTFCEEIYSDPYTTPEVSDCSLLPSVQIVAPRAGDQHVQLLGPRVPGSTIRVYHVDNGEEIGDSGGSRVTLRYSLSTGETIRVMQELSSTGCTAGEHYSYVVD